MKVRKEDASGDMMFGYGDGSYEQNSSEAVAICIRNRLKLVQGSWFLDSREGLNYNELLGYRIRQRYDLLIQNRIATTQGVLSIEDYASEFDPVTRRISISATVNTIYGAYNFKEAI